MKKTQLRAQWVILREAMAKLNDTYIYADEAPELEGDSDRVYWYRRGIQSARSIVEKMIARVVDRL